ncbi:MAG: hypothetical protein IIC06_00120 [Proteobacteria bacterium]|nr:hypothetical protein [Pseudomonadota bacterium]
MAETRAFGNGGGKGAAYLLLGAILLAAGLLRVWAASGDLWLDEITSLNHLVMARSQPSLDTWLALFFHDNTHPLNTLYLAAVGPGAGPLAYRALSVAAGIAAVAVAAAMGWRRSPMEGLMAAALLAFSYPMVHYAGEARGYSTMVLAALAAVWLMERTLDAPGPGRLVAFVLVSLLGLATHLSFLVIEAGLGIWAAAALFQRLGSPVSVAARLVLLFGLQTIAVTAYGAAALDNFVIAGGAFVPAMEAARHMAELTFGADPAARGSVAPAIALALAGAVWWLYRRGDGSWVFFLVVVLVYPLAYVIADPTLGMAPRYFIANALFALVIAARGLSLLMAGNRWTRAGAGGLLALFLIGNGLLLDRFLSTGRGDFAQAVRDIAAADDGPGPARVAGFHRFHVSSVVAYHARAQGLEAAVRYVTPEEEAGAPAAWFIDGYFVGRRPAPEISRQIEGLGLTPYILERVYPHWGLSGDTWAVYRRKGG